MPPPEPIGLTNLQLTKWLKDLELDPPVELVQALYYTRQFCGLQPVDNNTPSIDIKGALAGIRELIDAKSLVTLRAEADAGNPMSAIDYALRIQAGYDGDPDRKVFRRYLVKVITNPNASNMDKARAHGLLIEWHSMSSATSELHSQYLFAAAYHAHQCVLLSGESFSAVLTFGLHILEPTSKKVPQARLQFKGVWDALEKRKEEINRDTAQAGRKRAKKSNRYICAAVDCLIQVDKGKLLSQCAGRCDSDKKPSYCSKE
ncbi:hypothetical protein H0H92_006828 [Tricholoma furcatifolium]|nr:hypothetical protein H0H92_006828 [Tricholoma furcatifolium]